MYYLVTISYEVEKFDRKGNATGVKTQKSKCIVEAESVEEATIVASNYISEFSRPGECTGINKMSIDDVLHSKLNPKYYKK